MKPTSHLRRGIAAWPWRSSWPSGSPPAPSGGNATSTDPDSVSGEISLLTPIFEGTPGQKLLEDELLPQFYEKYPDVKVNVDYTTYGNLNEKLTTSAVSGLVPDVMLMGVGWVEAFADKRDSRRPQRERADRGEARSRATPRRSSMPARWTAGSTPCRSCSTPASASPAWTSSREAGYDAPPSSWDELIEIAEATTIRRVQRHARPAPAST